MSEAMISELIVESEWILKNYWTKTRFAYQTESGGWSDVDVLSYHPETKHLVISESKVRGRKKAIHAYTEHTKRKYGTILEYKATYFSFIPNIPKICSNHVVFTKFSRMVKTITIQLVSNLVIAKSLKNDAESSVLEEIEKYMKEELPGSKAKIEVMLDSTIDVISRVVEDENKHNQGRRYGHPMLDIAREINRYFYPDVGGAGKRTDQTESVKKQATQSFIQAINHREIIRN
ncbi:hypothetical protein [Candidatus Spongiihabitans sp.]|uniref:hypothetical protein n=1 Tax=Candidatus Spongiihabitans sp. TaxID=3101308 RepID=UPI003C6F509F